MPVLHGDAVDSVTAKKQSGEARDGVEVVDVAQLLLRSVR